MNIKIIKQNLFLISFIFLISLNLILSIEKEKDSFNKMNESLRFLGDSEVNFICEFPFSCGNGYITSKRICNDITNTLRKRNVNIVEKLEPKNISTNKRDFSKDEFFNIYISINNRKNLIATTNNNSEFYNKNLIGYPNKFITGFGVPDDKDFSQKFELIESIENGILNLK